MKKILLFSFAALLTFGLASCKKTRVCSCTETAEAGGSIGQWVDSGGDVGVDNVSTFDETIESGKCSDLNSVSGGGALGFSAKVTKTCVNK